MSVTLHFLSADGRRERFETLAAAPAKIRVPDGSLVEVIDNDSGAHLLPAIERDKRHCWHTDFSVLDEPVLVRQD